MTAKVGSYELKLSSRLGKVKPSATMAVTAMVAAMRAEGRRVIDLGAGEPDFDTPEHIKRAAAAAMNAGETKYTPVGGTHKLKEAIVAKLKRDNNLEYEPAEVFASAGGKHSLYNALFALLDDGDEVIIPAPYWVSYPDMVLLAGGVPKIVETRERDGFRMSPEAFAEAIGPRTKAVILNSPSNPTGGAYGKAELGALGEVAQKKGVFVISDDVYEALTYGGFRQEHILNACPQLREQTLVVNSVSKTYAMTGWRIGYVAGPKALIGAMSKIQGQSTSNPCSIAQAAAVAALEGPQDMVREMVREFESRRDFVVARLSRIAGVSCFKPLGAFYVFPNIACYVGKSANGRKIESAGALCEYLLKEAGVAVVGGEDFGAPTHIRISYATSMANLREGLDAIAEALGRIGL